MNEIYFMFVKKTVLMDLMYFNWAGASEIQTCRHALPENYSGSNLTAFRTHCVTKPLSNLTADKKQDFLDHSSFALDSSWRVQ